MGWRIFRNINGSQTCEAGSCSLALMKPGSVFIFNTASIFVEDDLSDSQSPGPDEAHFATQYVDNLRQLIQAGCTQNPTHTRDSPIVFLSLFQSVYFIGVRYHRAEFQNHKLFTKSSPTLLTVKDRAAVFELNGNCDENRDRGR